MAAVGGLIVSCTVVIVVVAGTPGAPLGPRPVMVGYQGRYRQVHVQLAGPKRLNKGRLGASM